MVDRGLERLLTIERRGWGSLCRSDGGTFYGRLMTPDALMILPNGMVLGRDALAASLNDAPPGTPTRSRTLGLSRQATSTALVYKATATREGEGVPFVALMASVYCLLDDEICLALYQQTTITH